MPEETSSDFHQLIAQLSPEEREQLALELSRDIQHPEETGDVADLARAIEAHLSQNPEASVGELPEDQQNAVNTVKSAEYIEGFLYQAMDDGVTIKQAVDMYDSALTNTLRNLKTAKLKGNQHKLDVDGDGKIEASDLKKLRHEAKESPSHEKAESPAEEKGEHMEEIKAAAYYEGLFSRAAEYGLSKEAAASLIKQARGGFVPKDSFSFKDALAPIASKIPGFSAESATIGDSSFRNPYYDPSKDPTLLRSGEVSLPNADLGEGSLDFSNPRLAGIMGLSQGSGPTGPESFIHSPEGQEAVLLHNLGYKGESPAEVPAMVETAAKKDTVSELLNKVKELSNKGLTAAKGYGQQGLDAANNFLAEHPDIAKVAPWALGGLGAAGLGYGAYKLLGGGKKKEPEGLEPKAAAYYEGLFKRASEYGLSQEQTIQLIQKYSK